MEPIILASASLRRQELCKQLGLPFKILPSYIDETPLPGYTIHEQVQNIAERKVQAAIKTLQGRLPLWILGADTVISLDNRIYGKPRDRDEAREMLQSFSGKTQEVITALALYVGRKEQIVSRVITSYVTFAELSPSEIEWYLDTGEWQGVAGAYQIQSLGACFISEIRGSYSNIVGLPIRELYVLLREQGYPYGAAPSTD
ncbi:MAG TPA: Maf family protein [Termitinemataceae bacterium]|jgi:septum formation protein|uniref:Maf family protein n=1 Tax=Treponema sp. J25 TaxID=2094121 RepID=UPI001051AB90|nr:Maf family protein [Treponema sp. J25]TCW60785.1 septum formation protein Maf [Treponema sp. J25]HOJ98163.1 Maf family protein [Termitinemataceae bacterium]HOM22427.1 Maf family protein [Termitinemataceae bacterium]HPP99573.1 Maf family protein [Termitinemataceae bacterium]